MKRLSAVLFVCFAVQFSAATAPFVHQHAKTAHTDDHDHEAVVHRHVTPHSETGDHHDDDQHDAHEDALSSSSAAISAAAGVMSAHVQARTIVSAPVTAVIAIAAPTAGAASPDDDVGSQIPHPPDLASSVLRGPPR